MNKWRKFSFLMYCIIARMLSASKTEKSGLLLWKYFWSQNEELCQEEIMFHTLVRSVYYKQILRWGSIFKEEREFVPLLCKSMNWQMWMNEMKSFADFTSLRFLFDSQFRQNLKLLYPRKRKDKRHKIYFTQDECDMFYVAFEALNQSCYILTHTSQVLSKMF